MKQQSMCKFQITFWLLLIGVLALSVVLVFATPLDNCAIGLILNIVGVLTTFFIAFPQPNYEAIGAFTVEDDTPMENGMTAGELRRLGERNYVWRRRCALLGAVWLVVGFAFQLYAQVCGK